MPRKTAQLQIRVTPQQKRTLRRLAAESSMDMSSWILDRVLPGVSEHFQELAAVLATSDQPRFALAELLDFLRALPRGEFERAVADAPRARLEPQVLNHLAATIELAAAKRGVNAPRWTSEVPIPDAPMFGSTLGAVRLHLLVLALVAMSRRNIFVDASLDQRV